MTEQEEEKTKFVPSSEEGGVAKGTKDIRVWRGCCY